ncbi:MAG: nucleotidyltransferase domain-containing protein [Candidatus Nezhaarchaeales archaeon]|uniref:nucleotidyltransferase domain-containing protein n=1 Tax=Thermofilum sp. TaxID=1961369 RepID=UPI001215B7F8|nr:nucleotidyltransferase domain-containing protein [Candidatus Nezhaarchaeota archaeon]TDA35073.1 MAG: nucleotidyltransferase domain-containing protein [Candidatus Nezhaarchaeota archaeon WYZ-LMO8]TDA35391.1 MAG: nucleotidyltransferase domain-containing protein [Candidatus Nezhaarchaeota archaeon WYZ-LMO7]
MSEKLLVKLARHRAEVFRNLKHYLKVVVETVKELDENAEVYLFGSVVEGTYTLSSDIDILVVTDQPPEEVLVKLWERGIKDPFEVHVIRREMLELYKWRSKLVKVEEFSASLSPRKTVSP